MALLLEKPLTKLLEKSYKIVTGSVTLDPLYYSLRRQRQISLSSARMSEDSISRIKSASREEE